MRPATGVQDEWSSSGEVSHRPTEPGADNDQFHGAVDDVYVRIG